MQIGANYNVAACQATFTPKAKEAGYGDQVILGENVTDNTMSMADQLKNMKSFKGDCGDSVVTASLLGGATACAGGLLGMAGACTVGGLIMDLPANLLGKAIGFSVIGGMVTGGVLGVAADIAINKHLNK